MNKHLSLLLTARSKQVKVEADWAAWLKQALSLSVLVALVKLIFPHAIPFTFWGLWNTTGSVGDWLTAYGLSYFGPLALLSSYQP